MKRLLLLTAGLVALSLSAQVTIGSAIKPKDGALLDLKENDKLGVNSTRGLVLPRVQLTSISSLDDIETGLDKNSHIGLTIYVPMEFEDNCPGVYTWTGTNWQGLNTDALRPPEFITEKDIDGNIYTAKLFNRKGCKGGVYWFTSNLRTTRKNDGTTFHRPLYFSDAKSYTQDYPFDEGGSTVLHRVRNKSDISTSTASADMIEFYKNNVVQRLTQDEFVTKFGLQYSYYMAMPKDGETEDDVKLCPVGWKVPVLADWAKLLEEVSGVPGITGNGAPYLFESDDIYEPIDKVAAFAPEKLNYWGHLPMPHPHPDAKSSLFTRVPKKMGGYPVGDTNNSGLNIYPAGWLRIDKSSNPVIPMRGLDTNFGAQALFLEIRNGAITLITDEPKIAGGLGTLFKEELDFANVRCIKVVE